MRLQVKLELKGYYIYMEQKLWMDLWKGSYMHNYEYLELPFWNISQECMEQLVFISPLIYSHSRPFSGWTLQWI